MILEHVAFQALFLSVVLMCLLVAVLLTVSANSLTTRLLILLGLFKLYDQTVSYLAISGVIFDHPLLIRSSFPFQLGSIPLAYLYISSFSRDQAKRRISRMHFLPFVFGTVWYLAILVFGPDDLFVRSLALVEEKYIRNTIAFAVLIPYLIKSRACIIKLKQTLKTMLSSGLAIQLSWLRFFLFLWYVGTAIYLFDLLAGPTEPLWFYRGFLTTFGLVGLTFFGLQYSRLLEEEKKASVMPAMGSDELDRSKQKIVEVLHTKELYLNPKLRLSDLSEATGIKIYRLSEAINRGMGTNFFDLVNSLRIEKAKMLLVDVAFDHMSLLGIAMESGFNSKSVFNQYFKDKVGLTPSEFRKQRGLQDLKRPG